MRPAARLKVVVFGGLAMVTGALSALSLVALNAGGEARLGPLAMLRVAAGYDRRVRSLLATPTPPSHGTARLVDGLSHQAIGQFPYDTVAWLQLAYVDTTQHGGRISPEGIADLQRSYDLVAIDPDVGLWRIQFALENWPWLTFELRTAVTAEAKSLGTTHRAALQTLHSNIRDPVGRLTVGLWLNELTATARK